MHIFICDVPRCDACLKMLMTSKLKATGTSKNVFHLMLMVAIEATEVQRTSHDKSWNPKRFQKIIKSGDPILCKVCGQVKNKIGFVAKIVILIFNSFNFKS